MANMIDCHRLSPLGSGWEDERCLMVQTLGIVLQENVHILYRHERQDRTRSRY
jgi:hypothetical protein